MFAYKVPSIKEAVFTTSLEVRIYDINYGQHLGNDSLVSLLHEARARFLKSRGFSESNAGGFGILVTNLVVNYVGQAFFAEKLSAKLGIGRASKTSLELIYQLCVEEDQREIARACTTITFYDYEKKKVSRIPPSFLASFEASVSE